MLWTAELTELSPFSNMRWLQNRFLEAVAYWQEPFQALYSWGNEEGRSSAPKSGNDNNKEQDRHALSLNLPIQRIATSGE